MVVLDFILIAVIIAAMVRGWQLGVIRQSIIVTGLVLGFWLGVVVVPWLAPYFVRSIGRTAATLVIFGLSLILLGALFDWLAELAKAQLKKRHHHLLDGAVGIVFGALYAAVLIWLAANVFLYGPSKWLSDQIKQSAVVRTIDKAMPNPPSALVKVRRYIANISLPQPFVGNEPAPDTVTATGTQADLNALVNKTSRSVVEVTGTGCGGIVEGSGFVAATGIVVTNAHVVAGVASPVVHDTNGLHGATTVYFNPDLDIALLRTTGLAGSVLGLNTTTQARGTFGAVIGYPGGGSLTGVSAYVLNAIMAVGRNIYNQGFVSRGIYTLNTDVQPGNSGGPYILSSGEVAGVVFARSESYANTGYAIRSSEVAPILASNKNDTAGVSTQTCAE